jgi:hypothetical protein
MPDLAKPGGRTLPLPQGGRVRAGNLPTVPLYTTRAGGRRAIHDMRAEDE